MASSYKDITYAYYIVSIDSDSNVSDAGTVTVTQSCTNGSL